MFLHCGHSDLFKNFLPYLLLTLRWDPLPKALSQCPPVTLFISETNNKCGKVQMQGKSIPLEFTDTKEAWE